MLRASSVASRRTSESPSLNSGAMNGAIASGNACRASIAAARRPASCDRRYGNIDLDACGIADADQRRHDGFAHARHRLAAESRGERRHRIRLTGERAGRRPTAFGIGTVERCPVRR